MPRLLNNKPPHQLSLSMIFTKGLIISFLTGVILFVSISAIGQSTRNCDYNRPHQADNWVFGNKAELNFTFQNAVATTSPGQFNLPYGSSSYSHTDGELFCFTNGMEVFNRGYYQMNLGTGLLGNAYATMNSIVVPHPGNSKQLFIFTVDMFLPPVFTNGVNYSIVDLSTIPSGEVIQKNNPVFTENAQKICAVMHENQRDYWVILHGFGDSKGDGFYTFLVDTGGVNPTPVISRVGYAHSGDFNNSGGYIKASSDGNKIAVAIPVDGVIELFDFNKSSGTLSGAVSSNPGDFYYPYGIEFSPDNSKLYVSTSPIEPGTNFLYQFDLNVTNPFATTPTVIEQFDWSMIGTNDSLMGALQLAPDGKIYLSKFTKGATDGKPTLSVIYNPNRAGADCNYNKLDLNSNTPFYLQGGRTMVGLPVFVTDYLNIPHYSFFNLCHHDTTNFEIRNTANVNAEWNFATLDADGILVNTDPLNPGFVFSEPGNYQVELSESWDGSTYPSFVRNVTINPLPNVDIGNGADTISILPNSTIRLDAGEYDYYSWSPGGSNSRYLDVTEQGLYTVTVTDTNCCTNSDQVFIQFSDLHFPNAFNPRSPTQRNQTFGVVGDVSSLAGFKLQIFDRWGKIIFETDDPTKPWDGKFEGGEFAPLGVYVWHSVFTTFESGLEPSKNIVNRGTVTLLR